jgi:hypothetical protein
MDKILKDIKVFETDDGFRIEVTGENAKEWLKCCIPGGKGVAMPFGMAMCCPTEETEEKEEKKEGK